MYLALNEKAELFLQNAVYCIDNTIILSNFITLFSWETKVEKKRAFCK